MRSVSGDCGGFLEAESLHCGRGYQALRRTKVKNTPTDSQADRHTEGERKKSCSMSAVIDEEADEAVRAHTERMHSMRLAENTKTRYRTHGRVFDRYVGSARVRAAHPGAYDSAGVFRLERLTTDVFLRFLSARRMGGEEGGVPDGKEGFHKGVGYKSLGLDKSALTEQLRAAGLEKPPGFDVRVKEYMKGVARDESNQRQSGELRSRVGKDELEVAMYRWLAEQFLHEGDSFAHLYLVLTWNLLNRAVNTKELLYTHMHWKEDALVVMLPKSKTNQVGKQRPTPKHVYANPIEPVICPILSLGVHSLLSSASDAGAVFPGGDQQNRFSKALKRVLDTAEGRERLRTLGLVVSDIGTHSIRKGASTYLLSGLAGGGPSVIAVLLRGEWTLGSVSDRYWKHQDAGDQYVGRAVTGLPLQESTFGHLPPHFAHTQLPLVCTTVRESFGGIVTGYPHMAAVLTHALGQVVHHSAFLRRVLPAEHPVFSTRLFAYTPRMAALREHLLVERVSSEVMTLTGLPVHVIFLQSVAELRQEIRQLLQASPVDGLASSVAQQVEARLLELGVVGRHVNSNYLHSQLREFRAELLQDISARFQVPSVTPPAPAASSSTSQIPAPALLSTLASLATQPTATAYAWPNGSLCRLPADYTLPKVPIRVGWELWHLGTEALPPLKTIGSRELYLPNQRKYLSSWRCSMSFLDRLAEEHASTLWAQFTASRAALTAEHMAQMYEVITPHLKFQQVYQEREGERSVTTLARLIMKRKRQQATSTATVSAGRRRSRRRSRTTRARHSLAPL
jgi:hypothetical protein